MTTPKRKWLKERAIKREPGKVKLVVTRCTDLLECTHVEQEIVVPKLEQKHFDRLIVMSPDGYRYELTFGEHSELVIRSSGSALHAFRTYGNMLHIVTGDNLDMVEATINQRDLQEKRLE